MKMKALFIGILVLLVFVAFPIGYIELLSSFQSRIEPHLSPGWEDNSFRTNYEDAVWIDQDFAQGWTIAWTTRQENGSAGFDASAGLGHLYATLNNSLGGIMVQKSLNDIDTGEYPYLVIEHKEASSDPSLMFSFGVTDDKGLWYDGGWYHTSMSWTKLEFDLRSLINGTIRYVSIRLTNDFNHSYAGGEQSAYIQLIGIYAEAPDWVMAYSEPINASISSENGTLEIHGSGGLSTGTIVSAQRPKGLLFNSSEYNYLKVSIKTSSINVAARVVVWVDQSHAYTVLLKTYDDNAWHTEIVDISLFEATSSSLYMAELGWMQIDEGNESTVYYRQLSFDSLGGY
jgi:hypothetical protein